MGGGGRGKGRQESELGDGEEPVPAGSSVQPWEKAHLVGKAVGMLDWIGEAMAQVLRKVGEHVRAHGRSLCVALDLLPLLCKVLVLHMMESWCRRAASLVGQRDGLPHPSQGFLTPPVVAFSFCHSRALSKSSRDRARSLCL